MTTYQTEADSLEADMASLNDLINQIRTLLETMDDKAEDLQAKGKKLLATLRGILQTQAELALLDQITGATPESPTPPTPPGP